MSGQFSPSGFTPQMTPGGTFKPGTEIHTDYWGYKGQQETAKAAGEKYHAEANARDKTGAGPSSSESPETPRPTCRQNKDWGTLQQKSFLKADHVGLGIMANDAAVKYEATATSRDNFNVKYEKVWRNKGNDSLKRHRDQAVIEHNTSAKFTKKEVVHSKYSK